MGAQQIGVELNRHFKHVNSSRDLMMEKGLSPGPVRGAER